MITVKTFNQIYVFFDYYINIIQRYCLLRIKAVCLSIRLKYKNKTGAKVMFKVNKSGTKNIIRKGKVIAPMLCLIGLSACSSFGWHGFGINSASALAPTANISRPANNGNTLLSMGNHLASQGNHNAAIPLFKSAHYKNSTAAEPLLKLGKSLMAVGRYDEALEVLISAKNKDRNNQETLVSLGQLYLSLYKPVTAGEYFSLGIAAATARPSNLTATAYSGLGVSLELSGDHTAAQVAFDIGLGINPDNMNLLSNKALSLVLNGKAEEAIEILLRLSSQPQAKSQHRQNLALAYVFHGDSKRAWQVASIDMTPNRAEQVVAGFYTLKGMEQANRMHALVYGMSGPRSGLERSSNKLNLNPDGSDASKRIAPKVAEPVVPQVVAEVIEEPAPSLPPLLDPRGWAVQIGAYRKPEEIIRGWEILKNRYFDIIGELEPRRSEVSFGARTGQGPSGFYYRLNAGPLSGYRQSRDVCTALVRAGGKCWIRPPEPSEGKLPE